MKSYNHITFKGTLGRDAKINNVGNNKVANFSVATEYGFKTKDGDYQTETTWLNVTAWQGFGICSFDELTKGTKVVGSGRLRTRKYTDNQGNEREITEIVVDNLDVIYESPNPSERTGKTTPMAASNRRDNKSYRSDDDMDF